MTHLDSKALWLFCVTDGLRLFIVVGFAGVITIAGMQESGEDVSNSWYAFLLLAMSLMSYGYAKLKYKFYRYDLAEHAYKAERGIVWKQYISIPYGRIQNVDIYRGPLARVLGLSDLHIETAGRASTNRSFLGGFGGEGRLPGLDRHVAETLRDELIKKAKASKAGV